MAGQDIDYSKADYSNEDAPADAPYGTGAPQSSQAQSVPATVTIGGTQDSGPAPASDNSGQYNSPQDESTMESAMSQEQAAKTAEAQEIENQGNAEAEAYANSADNLAKLPTQNDIVQSYAAKDKALADQYAAQKVNPDHFWQNAGTSGKITAGIGMLLSGFGSGASGQSNLAMKVIDDAISRDMDAQKNAQGQAQTLWKMNQENLGNATAANLATQNQLMTGLQYQINKAASQFKGPIAIQQAKQANALIEQQKVMNRQKLSLFGGPTQESPDPASRVGAMQRFGLITPEQAKSSLEEIKNAQHVNNISPQIMAAFDKGSSRNPNESAQGKREFEGLINTTVTDLTGTSRQAEFDSIHKNFTPSGLFAGPGEDAAKRQSVQEYLGAKSAAPFSKSIGVDLSKYGTTAAPRVTPQQNVQNHQQAVQWAQSHPKDPRSAKILKLNGIK